MRPVSVYLGIGIIPLLIQFGLRRTAWTRRISMALVFVAVFGLALAPWIARNRVAADYGSFSSAADSNLYFYCAAAVEGKLEQRNFSDIAREWGNEPAKYFQIHKEQRDWSQGRVVRYCRTEAQRILKPNLLTYSKLHARGCVMVMFNPAVSELLRDVGQYPLAGSPISGKLDQGLFRAMIWLMREYPLSAALIPLMLVQLIAYYLLAAIGSRRLLFEGRVLFAVLVLYFALISGIPGSSARYRAPIMPLVCICAGIAIANWKKKTVPV